MPSALGLVGDRLVDVRVVFLTGPSLRRPYRAKDTTIDGEMGRNMPGSAAKASNNVVRHSVTILGAGVATTAVLLSSGTAASAKVNLSMKADHKRVQVGTTIRFTGEFDTDSYEGVNGDQVCLWEYVKDVRVRQLAPCAPLRKRSGKPLGPHSQEGYFSIVVNASKPGRTVVVPIVTTPDDPKGFDNKYAEITIAVTR